MECCKQKYFQGVSKTKGLPENITEISKSKRKAMNRNWCNQKANPAVREYNNKSIAREYHNPKYCKEVPQTKVLPVNASIKGIPRSIIIKATARECQIQNDDRECINQKNCHRVSPIKRSVKKIRITIQSTKEYHIQHGLQCESTAIDYRIRNVSK